MVTFYLRTLAQGPERIYVRITIGRGRQYRFFTGWSLPEGARWDKPRGRIGHSRKSSNKVLNAQLGKMAEFIEGREIWALANTQTRDKAFYKDVLAEFKGELEPNREKNVVTLEEAFLSFIRFYQSPALPSTERLSAGTLKTYKTCLSHLESTLHGRTALSEIDMNWYRTFVKRSELGGREKQGLSMNYIGKLVKLVKRVLRFSVAQGEEVHSAFRSREFKVLTEEIESIYLNEEEIGLLRHLALDKDTSMGVTRDLFVVGCYTGLRYSDFSKLNQSAIMEHEGVKMFEVRSQKTGNRVSIPIHPIVKEVMSSRNGHLPPYQSDQLMNRNLKRLGAMAGLDAPKEMERTEGGTRRATSRPKNELIQTHTARRSFCTNAYLNGLDTLDIMAISGHQTEKNFLRYIKVTREQRAKRIASHAFFQA